MTNTDTTAKYLSKDDLYLLMESYRNMIDMYNALVNQQKEIIRNQNKSEERDIKSSAESTQTLYTLDRVLESLGVCISQHEKLIGDVTGQKEIIRNQNKSEERDIKSSAESTQTLYTLDRVLESLGVCISQNEKIVDGQKTKITEPVIAKVDSIKTIIDSNHLDLTKQHATLQHKIYISMIGMATIILALIALSVTIIEKYDILKEIYNILKTLN